MKLYRGNTRLSKPFLMNRPTNNGLPAPELNGRKQQKSQGLPVTMSTSRSKGNGQRLTQVTSHNVTCHKVV